MFRLLALLAWSAQAAGVPACLDAEGEPVDWWAVVKTASCHGVGPACKCAHAGCSSGFSFLYADAQRPALAFANGTILSSAHTDNAVAHTVAQLYAADASGHSTLVYSDQPPKEAGRSDPGCTWAHSKGALAIDGAAGGFWLTHSVPEYPTNATRSRWPAHKQNKFAQHMFCATMGAKALGEGVARALATDRVYVYNASLREAEERAYPALRAVLDGAGADPEYRADLSTSGGLRLRLFGKAGEPSSGACASTTRADLWEGVVAPGLGAPMTVQSWCGGLHASPPCIPSNCTAPGAAVHNVLTIGRLDTPSAEGATAGGGATWPNAVDHSKWAVSDDGEWACFADLNHAAGCVALRKCTPVIQRYMAHERA